MTGSLAKGEAHIAFKKTLIPFEQEGPAEEPLFVNMCHVAFHDDIVYIDVGVIPLDEVLNRGEKLELPFHVLSRLVMGVPALKNLQVQIESLLDRLGSRENETKQPPSPKRRKTQTKPRSA